MAAFGAGSADRDGVLFELPGVRFSQGAQYPSLLGLQMPPANMSCRLGWGLSGTGRGRCPRSGGRVQEGSRGADRIAVLLAVSKTEKGPGDPFLPHKAAVRSRRACAKY
jgi:hypothetical protein